MTVPDALAWTAPLAIGLLVWWATSFALGMAAMLLASALVWLVLGDAG